MIYISSFSQNQSSPFFIPPLFFPFKSQHCGREGEEEGRRKRDPIGLSHASKQPKTDSGGREKGKGIVRDLPPPPPLQQTTLVRSQLLFPRGAACTLSVGSREGRETRRQRTMGLSKAILHTRCALSLPLYVVTSLEAPSLPLFSPRAQFPDPAAASPPSPQPSKQRNWRGPPSVLRPPSSA